jgi:hypothetical protein
MTAFPSCRAGPPAYGHDRPAAVLRRLNSRSGARPRGLRGLSCWERGGCSAWADDAGESKGKMLADSDTTFFALARLFGMYVGGDAGCRILVWEGGSVRHPLETLYACSGFPTRTGIRDARSVSVRFKVEWWLIVVSGVDRQLLSCPCVWWLVVGAQCSADVHFRTAALT